MKPETRQALVALNRAFYDSDAALEFSASRQRPWPGWYRVLDRLPARPAESAPERPVRVLDVGCGNGRFTLCLSERWGDRFRYLGIDASRTLLDEARSRGLPPDRFRFEQIDFLEQPLAGRVDWDGYGLILVSGVLHHVPGLDRRLALLSSLLVLLEPGGRLAFTLWRFGAFERFRGKLVPWRVYNQTARQAVDADDLEPGDHLLSWGAAPGPVRYCHFADEEETERLVGALAATCVDSFDSDGNNGALNHYRVLVRR